MASNSRTALPAQGHDLSVDHTRARAARLDANHLRNCVEQAIKSAGLAYQFSPGSYTADTLADVTALRNLVAIVIERLAAALPEDEA